jgi:hypothetical protein
VVAKGIPGQPADFPVVLVPIVLPVRDDEIWRNPRLEFLEIGFDRSGLVWKVRIAKRLHFDTRARSLGEECGGRAPGLFLTLSGRAQDAPHDIEVDAARHEIEQQSTRAYLDIVGMRSETEER